MSQINITDFPEEILEKIFLDLYNSGDSLKSLTEVCKRFNHVIFSRPKFMSTFVAVCNKDSIETLLASNRKYHEIKIAYSRHVATIKLIKFLKIQKNSLTSIVFHCDVAISKLEKILKAIKNIREIRIENSRIISDQWWSESLNWPMMKKITLNNIKDTGITPLLNIFRGATNVEEFELNDYEVHMQSDEIFHEELPILLSNFTKLKRFVNNFYVYPLFLDAWLDKNITYHLEELTFVLDASSDNEFKFNLSLNDKIINYMNKQKHTLKKLHLGGFVITNKIIECVFSMDQLAELTIGNWKYDFKPRTNILNYSIKKLNFEEKANNADEDVRYMLSNCKNVQEVSFVSMDVTRETSSILSAQNNIEKLNFISCTIFPMTYSSVKSMELRGIRKYFNDMIKVMRINRQLKHLLLPDKIQTHQRYTTAKEPLELEHLQFYLVHDDRL